MFNIEELNVRTAEQEKDIKSLNHRVKDLENQQSSIQSLTLSVQELALNMKQMLDEQKNQSKRLLLLEELPAKKWNKLTATIITALASGIVGAVLGAVFSLL